jgi:hypothetical protein
MYAARRLVYDFAQRTELRLGRDDGDVDADFLRDGHQRLSQRWEIFFAREVPEDPSLSATCGLRDLRQNRAQIPSRQGGKLVVVSTILDYSPLSAP